MCIHHPTKAMSLILLAVIFCWVVPAFGQGKTCKNVFPVKKMKPTDRESILKKGDAAPDFTLSSVDGNRVTLSQYLHKQNVVISFVPAAWTPVCSNQWPVYDIAKDLFVKNNAIVLGISVDNVPTLYAWTKEIALDKDKLWFPVLSDFFPHGQVAKKYGVLRTEGFTERALFLIDKMGIIQFVDIHDINQMPPLEDLQNALEKINR